MGLRPSELIEQAARHLLAVLQTQGSILYSSFYDGSEEANARLCEGIGISVEDGEWYSAEALIDNAAAQLEQQGIVELDWLEARLVDDEPEYGSPSPTRAVRPWKSELSFRFTTPNSARSHPVDR